MARLGFITVSNRAGKRAVQPAIYTCAAGALLHSFMVTARNDFGDLRKMRWRSTLNVLWTLA